MARRTAIGVIFSGGGSIVTFRDSSEQNHNDKDIRCCSRSRCCASLHPRKGATPGGDREKAPFCTGPSKSFPASVFRKPQMARKSNEETDVAERSNRQGDSNRIRCRKASNSNRKPVKTLKLCSLPESPLVEAVKRYCSSQKTSKQLGSCNIKSSSGASKKVPRQIICQHKENSSAPGSVNGSENPGRRATSNASRSAMNYSDSRCRAHNILGKRPFQLGSSSSISVSMMPTPLNVGTLSKSASGPHQTPRTASRQRTLVSDTRVESLGQSDDPIFIANRITITELFQDNPSQSSTESSSTVYLPFYQPGSSSQIMHPFSEYQTNDCISPYDGNYEHYEIDENEESSQDDSYSDDLSLYDEYRDMRMEIDFMSYEELLALGERIGIVNTALTEEALLTCLKRRQYKSAANAATGLAKGDAKCSICQEEFGSGDNLGELTCEHFYHEKCIQQWLQLKNWCPICKVSLSSL